MKLQIFFTANISEKFGLFFDKYFQDYPEYIFHLGPENNFNEIIRTLSAVVTLSSSMKNNLKKVGKMFGGMEFFS